MVAMRISNADLYVDCRCTLGEGIVWDTKRRALFWTDIEKSTLWMHDEAGTRSWRTPDRLGCFALCASGHVLLALAKGLYLADIDRAAHDLAGQLVEPLEADLPRTRTNDGRTDRSGNFVFGTYNEAQDGATGSFYQYSARHGLRRLDLGGVTIPNSICFSVDGRTMYFCDSPLGRIMRCDYDAASARVANIREFVRFDAADGLPDGSIVDEEDCLWNAAWGAGRVRRYSPDGRVLKEIAIAAKNTTCPAFGGEALVDLFITSSRQEMSDEELASVPQAGSVFKCADVGVRGIPDAMFAGL
jgi:sugar lactone lactonase YvrE